MRVPSYGLLSAALLLPGGSTAGAELAEPRQAAPRQAAPRQAELRHLIRHDCGSCHGMTLKGGLGPSLTPEALAGKPRELLVNSIIHGRPGTAMPPWRDLLSEAEVEWIVERLLEGMEE
jgi:cytochrome c55X